MLESTNHQHVSTDKQQNMQLPPLQLSGDLTMLEAFSDVDFFFRGLYQQNCLHSSSWDLGRDRKVTRLSANTPRMSMWNVNVSLLSMEQFSVPIPQSH